MARRQDSGSNSSPENQRPTEPNEDRIPEFTDTRGRADDEDPVDDLGDEEMDDSDDEGL